MLESVLKGDVLWEFFSHSVYWFTPTNEHMLDGACSFLPETWRSSLLNHFSHLRKSAAHSPRITSVTLHRSTHLEQQNFSSYCVCVCVCVFSHSVTQLHPTLCGPMDYSSPGSSVHGISQARILEWVAISSSRDLPNPGIKPTSPASPASAGILYHWATSEAQ